ncbi:ABC-type sugar transport system substrate-binding protein [Paraburkholderia youngii]
MTSKLRRLTLTAIAAAALAAPFAAQLSAHADEPLKVGFLVKMPEQAWFINEQKAATALGQKDGFSVVNIGTPDGEKVLAAIDNLGAQGAKGFVICAPDVRLGPAIQARAKRYNMKFVTVDDQLVDSTGKPLANVPHLGMSAFKIGNQVGTAISEEMKRRGWKPPRKSARCASPTTNCRPRSCAPTARRSRCSPAASRRKTSSTRRRKPPTTKAASTRCRRCSRSIRTSRSG